MNFKRIVAFDLTAEGNLWRQIKMSTIQRKKNNRIGYDTLFYIYLYAPKKEKRERYKLKKKRKKIKKNR